MDIDYQLNPPSQRLAGSFLLPGDATFGTLKTDHMFLMNYNPERGWHSPRIVADAPILVSLRSVAFHYGIEAFEGAKFFQHDSGELYGFRLDQNAHRLNSSIGILGIPPIPVEDQVQAMTAVADVDRRWYPQGEGNSLYCRPLVIGVSESFKISAGDEFLFAVMLSPSPPYFKKGLSPIRLMLSETYNRTAPGGAGKAKMGAWYAPSLIASRHAQRLRADQVLYLNNRNSHLEEAGAMNHFQVCTEEGVVIPEFTDTILESITTRSFLELGAANRLSVPVQQRHISVIDFLAGIHSGRIKEAGGLGTAATVAPVGSYVTERGDIVIVGTGNVGEVTREMHDLLTGIQRGKRGSHYNVPLGWLQHVPRLERG